jgi:ABC-type molybdate transport system substrate-binding protein
MTQSNLRVAAAGAYEHALKQIVARFERDSGTSVALDIGNARAVAKMVESGGIDLVLTSAAGMADLAQKGQVDTASRRTVGTVQLGFAANHAAPPVSVETLDAFKATLQNATKVAHIDPQGGGTTGPIFVQMLKRLGLTKALAGKTVLCPSGRGVVAALADGRAQVGMTQACELIGVSSIRFVGYLPAEVQSVTAYDAALGAQPGNRGAAEALLSAVLSPPAAEIFRQHGWTPHTS